MFMQSPVTSTLPVLPRKNRALPLAVLTITVLLHGLLLLSTLRLRPQLNVAEQEPLKIDLVLAAPAVAPPPVVPAPVPPPRPRPAPKPVVKPLPAVVAPPTAPAAEEPAPVPTPLATAPAEEATVLAAPAPEPTPEPAPTPPDPTLPPVAITLPARALLTYDVGYGVSENLPRQARNITRWTLDNGRYTIESVGEAAGLVRLLYSGQRTEISRGVIAPEGLAPEQYTEERPKRKNNVYFTRNTDNNAKTITFSEPANNVVPLPAGVQDRLSVQFQLGALLQAQPALREVGTAIQVTVAGSRKLDIWTVNVKAQETLQIDGADVLTLRLTKEPRAGQDYDRTVDMWLAPSMHWLPVRVRISEPTGKALEQMLVKVERF
jgi:hypothetical protein